MLGSQTDGRKRRELGNFDKLCTINVLVGQSRSNDVIRGRHHLDPQTALVGVDLARRNIRSLTCTKRNGIHQECQDDSRITTVHSFQLAHQLIGTKRGGIS